MIRAGIAGLGRWGQVLVDSVQNKSDKITFTAGCTGRKAKAQEFCDANGIDLRDGLADLLTDPDLDAVVLATPHTQHADQLLAAAASGKHIFIEKPFTLTKESAEAAVAAVRQAGIVMALGHNRRFHPAMVRMRELCESGELGQLLHIEGNLSAPSGLRYTDEHWRASSDESPAGGMTGLGIHIVDAMISMMGAVSDVRALSLQQRLTIDMDDTTTMLFQFASGATGTLTTLTATAPIWRVQVFGTEGWAEMWNYDRLTIQKREGGREEVPQAPFDMERAELEAFADACTGGPAFPLTLDEAVQGAAALEAIITSSRNDGAVTKTGF